MPELYKYQKQAIAQLLAGKHFVILGTGLGKGAIGMVWAAKRCEETGKNKILVITTASKAHMKPTDYELDLIKWCPSSPLLKSLSSSLSVISWAKLRNWVDANWKNLNEYVVVADEIAAIKAGISSLRGRAFLKMAKRNPDWAGFTATPGESWVHYYPYYTACGLVRNKTGFLAEYANVQTFKGFPEIIGWRHEDKLRDMWARISYAPDASIALQELPKETHRVIEFSKPKGYSNVLKTRQTADGDFIDTTMGLCHYLRQICFTKDKEQWVKDFLENLGERAIIFYSYIAEGNRLEEIAKKAVSGKVWRIDGRHHDIPTEETCGEHDVIICQWQSGSEGLNAQYVNYWVSTTPNYSYSTSLQARGRIQRIGAKHPKFYYYLKCPDSIEGDVYEALAYKKDFSVDNWCANNNIEIKEDNGQTKQIQNRGRETRGEKDL